MKTDWRRYKNILLIITCSIITVTLLGSSLNAKAGTIVSETPETTTILSAQDNNMTMDIDYGYGQYAKYGRYMNVRATLTNEGEDFEGWLQVVTPKSEKNVLYRQETAVKQGDTVTESLNVPVVDDYGRLEVKLITKDNKTVVEKEIVIRIGNYDKQVYIGILSDDYEKLKYMDTTVTKAFHLDESSLSNDYFGLELLDVIVINHFDTNRLSEEQIRAIEKWVMKGGTLVIGTGEYAAETLSRLKDVYSIKETNHLEKRNINFGMTEEKLQVLKQDILRYEEERKMMQQVIRDRNEAFAAYGKDPLLLGESLPEDWANDVIEDIKLKMVSKNLTEVKLEGSFSEVMEQDQILLQTKMVGLGSVQLFSFDIGMEEEHKSFGIALLYTIVKNLSSEKQAQLQQEYYGSYVNYNIYNSISYTDTENIPNVMVYIIILVIYILIVGPVVFLILKKLDKRSLTWTIVPLLAISFTIMVYLFGSQTRIDSPYAGYVELLDFHEDNKVNSNVYFALTAPFNKKYSINMKGNYPISQLSDSNSNIYNYNVRKQKEADVKRYMTSINYGEEQTILEVKNNPAFSPVYYQAENTLEMKNDLIYDIHYTGEKIYGTVTNDFDYDLTNAMLMMDGYLINIGDIASGETVSLEGKELEFFLSRDSLYATSFINRIAGGTDEVKDNSAEINRKSSILGHLIEKYFNDYSCHSYFFGFAEDIRQDSLIAHLSEEINSYGASALIIPIQPDYMKRNEVFVPSIVQYMEVGDMYQSKYYNNTYIENGEKTVEYLLPADENILYFEYLTSRNQINNPEYQTPFTGKIYFLNNKTGDYDQVFDASRNGRVANLTDYITEQHKITIRYTADISAGVYQSVLPHISYWKEVDANAGN